MIPKFYEEIKLITSVILCSDIMIDDKKIELKKKILSFFSLCTMLFSLHLILKRNQSKNYNNKLRHSSIVEPHKTKLEGWS